MPMHHPFYCFVIIPLNFKVGLTITDSFTSRRFTRFSINSMAHYKDGPCGSTKSYTVANAELFTGLGASPNRSLTCLLIGDWCDNRPVDKSRMNREVHVRFCEGLRGKLPRSTRPLNRLIFGLWYQYRIFPKIPELIILQLKCLL